MFARITKNLVAREPPASGQRLASVSMIVQERNAPSVLLIRRADRAGDPWSGQIAFPGGKTQPEDRSARETAVRETLEEVGIDLNATAEFLGYGPVTTTHTGTMDVVPVAFELKGTAEIRPNEEVASYRWVGLRELFSPASRSSFRFESRGGAIEMPAYELEGYVVWGLTYRILSVMCSDAP